MTKDFEKLQQETKLRSPEDGVRLRTNDEVEAEQEPGETNSPAQTVRLNAEGTSNHEDSTATDTRTESQVNGKPSEPITQQVEVTNKDQVPFKPLTTTEKITAFVRYLIVPSALVLAHYLAMPGLYVLGNPVVRTIMLGLIIWYLIGGAVYAQCRSWIAKVLCIIIFVMPMLWSIVSVPIIGALFHPDVLRAFFHL